MQNFLKSTISDCGGVRDAARFACALSGLLLFEQANAAVVDAPIFQWNTEMTSWDLHATNVLMPLGPGPNWSEILTDVHISLSTSHRSLGQTTASSRATEDFTLPEGQFFVSSFFDVFFDFSVKDVDPAVNFGGNASDGQILSFTDIGPAHMENFYIATFDANAPNFGLIPPPESAPYIGFFTVEIPLGADLNQNGEGDKIKFILAALTHDDENRTFITLPDGTVIDNTDAIMDLSGAVVDESQDPPFSIQLTGPTTATSQLLTTVPDAGSTFLLQSVALGALACFNRRRGRKAR